MTVDQQGAAVLCELQGLDAKNGGNLALCGRFPGPWASGHYFRLRQQPATGQRNSRGQEIWSCQAPSSLANVGLALAGYQLWSGTSGLGALVVGLMRPAISIAAGLFLYFGWRQTARGATQTWGSRVQGPLSELVSGCPGAWPLAGPSGHLATQLQQAREIIIASA